MSLSHARQSSAVGAQTFGNAANQQIDRPCPDYLLPYTVEASNGDQFIARWDPFYTTRYKALLDALSMFDSNPAFGGIATQETAMGSPARLASAGDRHEPACTTISGARGQTLRFAGPAPVLTLATNCRSHET